MNRCISPAATPWPGTCGQPPTLTVPKIGQLGSVEVTLLRWNAERVPDTVDSAPEPLPERIPVVLPSRLLAQATAVNAAALETTGKPASLRALMTELRIGQDKAKDVKRALSAVPATS